MVKMSKEKWFKKTVKVHAGFGIRWLESERKSQGIFLGMLGQDPDFRSGRGKSRKSESACREPGLLSKTPDRNGVWDSRFRMKNWRRFLKMQELWDYS